MTIPDDFPLSQTIGSVPGVQSKLLIRKVDDEYVFGLTTEELQERYEVCVDLVVQLTARVERKRGEGIVTDDAFYADTERRIAAQSARNDWGLSAEEMAWIFTHVRGRK